MSNNNSNESLFAKAKLLVCSPSYTIGNLAGAVVTLVKDRRLGTSDAIGNSWGMVGGSNYIVAELGLVTKATSAAFISKVVMPWLAASLVVDGFFSREPFAVMRRGYRDARPRLG